MSIAGHTRAVGDWIAVQKKTFTRWCNIYLARENLEMTDIYKDMDDGVLLNVLLKIISNGGELGDGARKFKFNYNKKPKMRIHKLENISKAIKFMKAAGLRVTVEPNNVVKDSSNYSEKHILGMIWMLILRYEVDVEL